MPVGDTRAPGVPLQITENSQGCSVDDSFLDVVPLFVLHMCVVFLFLQLHMILFM